MPGEFQYIPPREVDARHAAAKPKMPSRETRTDEQKNVQAVLSLGSVRYFTYRRYLLAIPPVPFQLGQQILAHYIRSLAHAKQVAKTGDEEPTAAYYAELAILVDLLWSHVQPVTRTRRWLKKFGLLRNVLRGASEKEVQDITNFFLQGRMMSAVQAMEMDPMGQTQTFSTNFKSS